MNSPQQNGAAPAAAPAAPSGETSSNGIIPSYEERRAAAFGESSSESAVDPNAPPASPPASAAVSGDEAAKRAERRKQLDAVLASERGRVDAQARMRQGEEAMRRAAALERRLAEQEQQASARIDPSKLDEAGFFDLAEKMNVTPKALGEWLRRRAEHPEVIAAQFAQKAIDPKFAALEKQLADQNAALERVNQERAQERAVAQAYERGSSMINFTEAASAQAPYSANFLSKFGAEEYLKLANSAFASVPQGPGWEQAVLDSIEDNLSMMAQIYAPQGAAPQQRQAPTPPNPGAAKPMTTVSNTLAQERASVVDEEADWAALPFEERARRAFL